MSTQTATQWATSRDGTRDIALGILTPDGRGSRWAVWSLYAGTHDMAPGTRHFTAKADARAYANRLWAR